MNEKKKKFNSKAWTHNHLCNTSLALPVLLVTPPEMNRRWCVDDGKASKEQRGRKESCGFPTIRKKLP